MSAGRISFGPFVLDRGDEALLSDGKPVAIGRRGYALLAALAEADGAVSKQALMEAAWPDAVVEEGNLTVQIAALRKALGTRPDGQDWIVTVPRLGYRLLRPDHSNPAAPVATPVVAVMPFQHLGAPAEDDFLAQGLAEDINTALGRFKSFRTLSRQSTAAYVGQMFDVPEAATALGAQYLLMGSVRRAGQRLRITAQLVNGRDGTQIWTEAFDGLPDQIFETQARIVVSVAAAVDPRIRDAEIARVRAEPTSLGAYELYLRGYAKVAGLRSPQESAEGLALLDRAIALDPDYSKAIAIAAWGYEHRLHMGWPPLGPDDMGKCLALARAALARADGDSEIIAHCGIILQLCAHEWDQGIRTVERAIELNPNAQPAQFFGGVAQLKGGDLDKALAYFSHVEDASPSSDGPSLAGMGWVLLLKGEFDEALALGERALAITPSFGWPHWLVICAHHYLGHADEARRALATYRTLFPEVNLRRIRLGQAMKDPARAEMMFAALAAVGLPED
jgi:TolB-like protein